MKKVRVWASAWTVLYGHCSTSAANVHRSRCRLSDKSANYAYHCSINVSKKRVLVLECACPILVSASSCWETSASTSSMSKLSCLHLNLTNSSPSSTTSSTPSTTRIYLSCSATYSTTIPIPSTTPTNLWLRMLKNKISQSQRRTCWLKSRRKNCSCYKFCGACIQNYRKIC